MLNLQKIHWMVQAPSVPLTRLGEQEAVEEAARERGVTPRSVLIGTVLIPVNTYWIIQVEGIWHRNHATAMSLFWNTVFCLMILILVNVLLLKRFLPRYAFTQGELIVIYVMITIASALAGHDTLQLGIPALSMPFWGANETNGWNQLFNHYFPKWLTVQDKEFLRPYYEGHSSLYIQGRILVWLKPVLIWSLFIGVMGLVMVCLNVILRKQWMENEKLTYPIVQLPMAMVANGGNTTFFLQKPLIIGALLGGGLDVLNGLHVLFPAIPQIVVRHDDPSRNLQQYFTSPPWNGVGWFPLPLYPFIIALGYFLPVDLSFSIWFFFLLKMALRVVATAAGVEQGRPYTFPFFNEQSYGAWFAIFAFAIWGARHHLREVWRKAINPLYAGIDDSREALSYRGAVVGLLLGMLFLVAFCVAAGMKLWVVVLFFLIFFIISVGITRVRAELGPPAHEVVGMNSQTFLIMMFGSTAIGAPSLTMMTMFWWFSGRGYRTHPMPCQLEAMKMAQQGGINMKGMGWVMMFAMFFGGLASYWAALHLKYANTTGVDYMDMHNWGNYYWLESILRSPREPSVTAMLAVVFGFAAASLMHLARLRFLWWPFHPAGYALSLNFGVEYFWSCLVIASVIKWLVLRYGGYKLNRQMMPFMFGVILGEYCVGAFWSAMSVILDTRMYDFCPG
ncbi:MAG: DUF6785 family protein [Armatimonadota bacterium]